MRHLSRRSFIDALLIGTAGLSVARRAFSQAAGGPTPMTALRMTERVAALSGNGGNVLVIMNGEELLLIDGGNVGRGTDTARALAELSAGRIQVLFNTHYHFDHVGSNELAGMAGARIIAHEHVAHRLTTTFDNVAMARTMERMGPIGLPNETFTTGGRITFGRDALEYIHEPRAHTDGDAYVYVESQNILHTGDLFWVGRYPVVDYSVGGSLGAMAEALGRLETVGNEATRIVPGHGRVDVRKADLRTTREIWLTINGRLEEMARQGRSLDEMLAALPTKDFDERVGVQNPQPFLRQAWGGVLARMGGR